MEVPRRRGALEIHLHKDVGAGVEGGRATVRGDVAEADGFIQVDGGGKPGAAAEGEAEGAEGAGEGDGGEQDLATDAVAAEVFGDGHLGEFELAGELRDEGAAADGAGAGEGHEDVAAGVEDAGLRVAEVEVVAVFHAEVVGDPLLVEGEEGGGIGWLEGADLNRRERGGGVWHGVFSESSVPRGEAAG